METSGINCINLASKTALKSNSKAETRKSNGSARVASDTITGAQCMTREAGGPGKAYLTQAAIRDIAASVDARRQRRQSDGYTLPTSVLAHQQHVHSSSVHADPCTAKPRHAKTNRQNGFIQRNPRLRR